MKVLLLQLPVPDNRFTNLPLALGYLKAMADSARLPGVEVELLDATLQNRAGDALLLDTILSHDPDLVGFSLYTWNSSRVLGLAGQLKEVAPEILLLAGGPEINQDGDWVLASPAFDFLVQGEGERTFLALLTALNQDRRRLGELPGLAQRAPDGTWRFGPPQPALPDVNDLPSAYLGGALDGHLGRFMSVELSRWCPSKCTFCYYGRQDLPRGGKRYFDLARVREELEWGRARGVEQVHFVEANFNTLPHLPQLYAMLGETGLARDLSFYAELRGEAIDADHARRLAECNFSTVEVGLQSAVPEVLARVRRKNHLPRLVAGVHHLREAGIEVFLDVILGLPGETPATFERTLAFMRENALDPFDLFHLQILPGTQLKAEALAGQHGLRWQAGPPYFVLETAELSFEDLVGLRRRVLQAKGVDPAQVVGLPQPGPFALAEPTGLLSHQPTGPVERVILDLTTPYQLPELSDLARRLGSEVTVWLKLGAAPEAALERVVAALQTLSEPNPSGMWQLFVQSDQALPQAVLQRIADAIHHQQGYLDRLAVFAQAEQAEAERKRWPSVRLFEVRPFQNDPALPNTVWQLDFAPTESLSSWQIRLEAAHASGHDLYLTGSAPDKESLARWKAALSNVGQVWLSDDTLAAGLAAQYAEDGSDALTSLDYPLTACVSNGHLAYCQPTLPQLQRAALAYQLASPPKLQPSV